LKSILLTGDSFSADWPDATGWPDLLACDFHVVNLSQAGCSEYKIYKQLVSADLDQFDHIVISHTSPYRLPVDKHPLYRTGFRKDADVIYSDILEASKERPALEPLVQYFEHFMSIEYQDFVYKLLMKEIINIVGDRDVIHMTHLKIPVRPYPMLDFCDLWKEHRGDINHYDEHGNKEVYKEVKRLCSVKKSQIR